MQFPNPIVNRLVIYGPDGLPDITIGPTPLITFYDGALPMIYIGQWGGHTEPRFRVFAAGDPDGAYVELAVTGNIPYIKLTGFVGLTPVAATIQMLGTTGVGRLRIAMDPIAGSPATHFVMGFGVVISSATRSALFDYTDGFVKVAAQAAPWDVEVWHEIGAIGEPIFDNSFGNLGGGIWDTVAFRMMPDGTVQFKGAITRGVVPANDLQMFQLPAAYRPALRRACAAANLGNVLVAGTNYNAPSVRIYANGAVTLWQANQTTCAVALDSVRFTII